MASSLRKGIHSIKAAIGSLMRAARMTIHTHIGISLAMVLLEHANE
jgi:hypothetical protein